MATKRKETETEKQVRALLLVNVGCTLTLADLLAQAGRIAAARGWSGANRKRFIDAVRAKVAA